jgi:hypothetical protein
MRRNKRIITKQLDCFGQSPRKDEKQNNPSLRAAGEAIQENNTTR